MDRLGFQQEAIQALLDIAAECVLMDAQRYEVFKTESLRGCDEKAKPFLCRALSIIDTVRRRKDNA